MKLTDQQLRLLECAQAELDLEDLKENSLSVEDYKKLVEHLRRCMTCRLLLLNNIESIDQPVEMSLANFSRGKPN